MDTSPVVCCSTSLSSDHVIPASQGLHGEMVAKQPSIQLAGKREQAASPKGPCSTIRAPSACSAAANLMRVIAGRWEARIGIPGSKHVYLGLFEAEETAAQACKSQMQHVVRKFANLGV